MACKAPEAPPAAPPAAPPEEVAPPVAPPEEVEKPPVKIAGTWYTTGEVKSQGDLVARGVMLAVDELNKAGGIMGGRQIEVTIYDEGTTADAATTSARKAVADGMVAAVGGSDASTIMVWQSVLRDAYLPYATTGGSCRRVIDPAEFAYEGYIHPVLFPEVSEAALWDWLAEERGVKTVAIMGFDVEWTRDFVRAMRAIYDKPGSPIKIVGETVYFPIDQTTCELETSKAVDLDTDAIYGAIWSASTQVSFFETAKRLGYPGYLLISPDSIIPVAVEEAGEAGDGVLETALYLSNPSPQSKAFDEAFEAKYGHAPTTFEEQAYETTQIALRAMDIAGTGGGTAEKLQRIAEALQLIDWVTPRGFPVKISKYGQVWAPEVFIGKTVGGTLTIVPEDVIEMRPLEEWPLP